MDTGASCEELQERSFSHFRGVCLLKRSRSTFFFLVEVLSSVGVFLSSFVGFEKLRGARSWSMLLFRLGFDLGSVLQSALVSVSGCWKRKEEGGGSRGFCALRLRRGNQEQLLTGDRMMEQREAIGLDLLSSCT